MCSGSEAGSYLRRIDFVYHSTLGSRVTEKKKMKLWAGCAWRLEYHGMLGWSRFRVCDHPRLHNIYVYIYIYIERERERERQTRQKARERKRERERESAWRLEHHGMLG